MTRTPKRAAVDRTPVDPAREPGSVPPPVTEPGTPPSRPAVRSLPQSDGTPGPAGGEPATGVSPSAGSTPRTFTIALPPGIKLLSLNDRAHWATRYRRSQEIKRAAWATAVQAKIPRLGRVVIEAEYQPPDRRHRDADNPVASVKAAVDGIVAAGCLLSDESPRYVKSITCTIGEPYPLGRLVLHLTEVTP